MNPYAGYNRTRSRTERGNGNYPDDFVGDGPSYKMPRCRIDDRTNYDDWARGQEALGHLRQAVDAADTTEGQQVLLTHLMEVFTDHLKDGDGPYARGLNGKNEHEAVL